jgi:hypothetical protein
MAQHPTGNGSGKFTVVTHDMGGWVRVFTDPLAFVPVDLPVYLSHSLTNWFRQHPQLSLRAVLPVTRDGNTVELHAWYDLHVFPNLTGQKPEPLPPREE